MKALLLTDCPSMKWNPSRSSTIASTAMSAITSPLAIVLNLLVIIAVAKKRQLRAIYNILLASMAVADFLIGVVARPLFISTGILRLQNDYETMCSFVRAGFLVMYVQSAYICHLTVIAWERYVAVKKRVTYKLIVTRRRMKICIIVAWVLTAISVVPSAMYRADHIGKKPFAIASACVSSIPLTICLVSTVYYYMTIYLKVRQTNANSNLMNGVQVANVACARASLEKEIAKTAFLLTVALLVSFVPTFLLIFLKYLCDVFSRDAFLWSVTLNQMNSFVSPILYFYRNRRFRNTVLLKLRKLPTIPMSPKEANRNMVMQSMPRIAVTCRKMIKQYQTRGNQPLKKVQVTSSASRPVTAPACPEDGTTPQQEVFSPNRGKRRQWTSKRREATTTGIVNGAEQLKSQLCPVQF